MIGTAGWSVPRAAAEFPEEGSALERYSAVFSAVEVNSSFYRRHRPATWKRWHDAVPDDFKFSVKVPQIITHDRRLRQPEDELGIFFEDVAPLGAKLGAVLIQLPPKLEFDLASAQAFLAAFRAVSAVPAYIEPRHLTWAEPAVSELLRAYAIGRVYADPQERHLQALAADPLCYLRLHGSPKVYYSAYSKPELERYASLLKAATTPAWCIFDNTASGAAIGDALQMLGMTRDR
ncbi:MAG: hypothetical protein JWQ22_3047 [Devosia sp.]|nr:hypothetical protein [Devosia sp.]